MNQFIDEIWGFSLFLFSRFALSFLERFFFRVVRRLKIASLFVWFWFFAWLHFPAEICKISITMDVKLDGWIMSFLNHSSYTQSFSIIQFWWRGKVLVQVYGHYQGLNLKNQGEKNGKTCLSRTIMVCWTSNSCQWICLFTVDGAAETAAKFYRIP